MTAAVDRVRPVSPARRREAGAGVVVAAGIVLLLLAIFVGWPVARVLAASVRGPAGFTLAHYTEFFSTWRLARILVQTLAVSAVSTVLAVTLAMLLAYAVTRTDIPGKRLLSLIGLVPLISPPFLVSLALILLLGRDGVVTRALGLDWSIDGFAGIVVAQGLTFLPQASILLAGVLGAIDTALEEAAENLGAGPLTIVRRVTLSRARPGLASAALVVFILCMADFGNPILIGGRYHVLATEIYGRVVGMNDVPAAAAMSVVLLVPCLLAYLARGSAVGFRSSVTVAATSWSRVRPTPAVIRWPLFAVSGAIALGLTLPYGLVLLGSFVRLWGSDWSLSLHHYTIESMAWPVWASVRVALVAGVAGTGLALVTAYVIERTHAPGGHAIAVLALLPAALPGTLVGVAYLLAFDGPLVGTVWILVAAVVFWTFPVAVLAGIDALERIDPAAEEAAVSLGAGAVSTSVRIVLPLLAGAAASIFVHFFIDAMVTVSAVVFLVSPGSSLASVAILTEVRNGHPGVACALATILLVVIGAVLALRPLVGGERLAVPGA